jgi:hypothetical protein
MALSGACTVTPGKVLSVNEKVTRAILNLLGMPTVRVAEGSITDRELNSSSVIAIVARIGQPSAIMNGNFNIWQRGGYTNLSGLPVTFGSTGAIEYTADRWAISAASSTNYREISRQAFDPGQTQVPNEPQYFLRFKQLVGDTNPCLSQSIEDVRTFAGKTVTVSGYLRSDTTGNVTITFRQWYGGSPGQAVDVAGQTVALVAGAQWKKFELHFNIPTLLVGGSVSGVDAALTIRFTMPSSVTFQTDFSEIKLEEGNKATAFVTAPIWMELEQCQRYFQYHEGVFASSITTIQPAYYFATTKYRTPDLTLLSGYSGTGGAVTALDQYGYRQTVAHSAIATFYVACNAEVGRS